MKIVVHGPAAGPDHQGMIQSWAPDQEVEIDDGDKQAVAWARKFAATPLATLVEDVKETKAPPRQPGSRA
jgi:hypothetical protein